MILTIAPRPRALTSNPTAFGRSAGSFLAASLVTTLDIAVLAKYAGYLYRLPENAGVGLLLVALLVGVMAVSLRRMWTLVPKAAVAEVEVLPVEAVSNVEFDKAA